MGLVNARNLRKAKQLLDKNRHKVGDVVGKATEKIDKVSGGKTSDMSKKVEEAARKYSAGGATHHGEHPDAVSDGQHVHSAPVSDAEVQRRQGEASIAATNALAAAANAATNVMNQAAQAHAKATGENPPPAPPPPPAPGTASTSAPPPLDGPPPLPDS